MSTESPPNGMSRREELLSVATKLFAARGYHGTRMDDVADAVGLNKATVYHYYASKSLILYDIYKSAADFTVAALHDEDGRVQVPGFYDDVLDLTDDERALFAKVPHDDTEFLKVAQSRALHGEKGQSTLERLGARPTAEVNGIGGGYQGAGHKTIVPSDAFVKISFRLVAAQDPAKITRGVEQFVSQHTPEGITAILVTHDVEEAVFLANRVIVFSDRPARIIADVSVGKPHPRRRDDADLVRLRRTLLEKLGVSDDV